MNIQFWNCVPDFTQYPERLAVLFSAQSEYYRILIPHLPCQIPSLKRLTILPYKLYVQPQTHLSFFFFAVVFQF